MHPPNKAICKYIVCFEQTFCSGSIWLTRIIKHLNKNHCLLTLESVQLVVDSLEGWQKARCTVLGDIQTSTEGPLCHLPPPLVLGSRSNHFHVIRERSLQSQKMGFSCSSQIWKLQKVSHSGQFQKHLEWPPVSQVQRRLSTLHLPSRVKYPFSVFYFSTQWEKLKPFKLKCVCSPCRVLQDIMC